MLNIFHSHRTKVWLWFIFFPHLDSVWKILCYSFLLSLLRKSFTSKPTHPSQVPWTPPWGSLWLTLAKGKLYKRIHSSLTNFFFSTHVDSLEIVRRNLVKVIAFYCFLCKKKKKFLYDKLIAHSVLYNSTPISRVPTRKRHWKALPWNSSKLRK